MACRRIRSFTPLRLVSLLAWRRTAYCRSDRKSTRLNSSHQIISYAVFCLKKKKKLITADGSLKGLNSTQTEHHLTVSVKKLSATVVDRLRLALRDAQRNQI